MNPSAIHFFNLSSSKATSVVALNFRLYASELPPNLLKILFPTLACLTGGDNRKHLFFYSVQTGEQTLINFSETDYKAAKNNTEDVSRCDTCLQLMVVFHKMTRALGAAADELPFIHLRCFYCVLMKRKRFFYFYASQ